MLERHVVFQAQPRQVELTEESGSFKFKIKIRVYYDENMGNSHKNNDVISESRFDSVRSATFLYCSETLRNTLK
jgi:hypothetical protein